jgi:hypothetical protein
MKNMREFKKFSIEELKDTWEKFGSEFFPKFEDYVAEVRKSESDLHAGWITQEELKAENDERINEI